MSSKTVIIENTKSSILKIRDKPHLLGHIMGYKKLKQLHSNWIWEFWGKEEDSVLLAHRGSFKTTSLVIVAIIWLMLFFPEDRFGIMRKKYEESCAVIRAIKNAMLLPEIQQIFKLVYGFAPKFRIKRANKLEFVFKKRITPEGNVNAFGVTSNITGAHLDRFIGDDVITLKDRISRAERENTKTIIKEVRANIMDKGKFSKWSGTRWHKNDGFEDEFCLGRITPLVYNCYQTGLLKQKEINIIKQKTTPALFAINYELKHIADENAIFKDMLFDRWDYKVKGIRGHLDAGYKGDHFTALTFMGRRKDGKLQAVGFAFREHIKKKFDFIMEKYERFNCGTIYMEENADKGFVAIELKKLGAITETYHEKMNKHVKIVTYLKSMYADIIWSDESDDIYLELIVDYMEGEEPDDSPDSAASLIREAFYVKKRSNALWEW